MPALEPKTTSNDPLSALSPVSWATYTPQIDQHIV